MTKRKEKLHLRFMLHFLGQIKSCFRSFCANRFTLCIVNIR